MSHNNNTTPNSDPTTSTAKDPPHKSIKTPLSKSISQPVLSSSKKGSQLKDSGNQPSTMMHPLSMSPGDQEANSPQAKSSQFHAQITDLRTDLSSLKTEYKQLTYSLKQFLSEEVLLQIFNHFIERTNDKIQKQRSHYEKKIHSLQHSLAQKQKDTEALEALQQELESKRESEQKLIDENRTLQEEKSTLQQNMKQKHQQELSELREQHKKELQSSKSSSSELEHKWTEKLERQIQEVTALSEKYQTALRALEEKRQQDLETLQEQHETALNESHSRLTDKLSRELYEAHTLEMEQTKKTWEAEILQPALDRIKQMDETILSQKDMIEESKEMIYTLKQEHQLKQQQTEHLLNEKTAEVTKLQQQQNKLQTKLEEQATLISADPRITTILQKHEKSLKAMRAQRNKWRMKCTNVEISQSELSTKLQVLQEHNEKLMNQLQHHNIPLSESIDEEVVDSKQDTISILNRIIQKLNCEIEVLSKQKKKQQVLFKSRERDWKYIHDKEVDSLRTDLQKLREGSFFSNDSKIERTMLSVVEGKYRHSMKKLKSIQKEMRHLKERRLDDIRIAIERITIKYRAKIGRLEEEIATLQRQSSHVDHSQEKDALISMWQSKYHQLEKDYRRMVDQVVR